MNEKLTYVPCPRCEGKGHFKAWGRKVACLACSGRLNVPEPRAEQIRKLMKEGER